MRSALGRQLREFARQPSRLGRRRGKQIGWCLPDARDAARDATQLADTSCTSWTEVAGPAARQRAGQQPVMNDLLLAQVLVYQFGHLKHGDLFLAAEDLVQAIIRIDVAAILAVLKPVALDIRPDFLGHFGSRHR